MYSCSLLLSSRAQAALKQVKQWVEQAIPDEYLADRTCCVDVSEVRSSDETGHPFVTPTHKKTRSSVHPFTLNL
jgi:hypothetical protein